MGATNRLVDVIPGEHADELCAACQLPFTPDDVRVWCLDEYGHQWHVHKRCFDEAEPVDKSELTPDERATVERMESQAMEYGRRLKRSN